MSTERLGPVEVEAVPGTTGVPVTDLGDTWSTSPPVDVDPALRPPDWPALFRAARTVLLLAAVLVAGLPAPRAVPSTDDIGVTVHSDAGQADDGQADDGLGTAAVRIRLRNNGTGPLDVGQVHMLGVGPAPDVLSPAITRLAPGDDLSVHVRLQPDCRDLAAGDRLAVRLNARGPGGGGALQLPAEEAGDPLGAVCPRPRAGMHVVATAYRASPDASALDVRLVNDGTLWATVVAPAPTAASFDIQPALPLRLEPGQAMVLRLRRLTTGPGCAVAGPRLEARSRNGYEAVRDEAGALTGPAVAADTRC